MIHSQSQIMVLDGIFFSKLKKWKYSRNGYI